MLSPVQTFNDNMRPSELLLQVYGLLDSEDQILTEGDLVDSLKGIVEAAADEDVMVVYNELFIGMVRERARIPRSTLRQATLCHLLRQSIVVSCTALDAYLPALLRENIPTVIRALGRDFIPVTDGTVRSYFDDLKFSLEDTLRLIDDPNASEYISGKILGLTKFSYLSSQTGIHVVGSVLGLQKPWDLISERLNRDKNELVGVLKATVGRRNDIVHRADRDQDDPEGQPNDITFAWTKQSVDTTSHICLALDELVSDRIAELTSASQVGVAI